MTDPDGTAHWIDLPALVEQIRNSTGTADPTILAQKIATHIPPEQLPHLATEILLPLFIRTHQPRISTAIALANPNRNPTGTPPSSASWKVASLHAYAQLMSTPVHLDDHVYKQLGDCTPTELIQAAQRRFTIAERVYREITRAGTQYQQLAELCQQHQVTNPRELPAEVVTAWLAQQNGTPTGEEGSGADVDQR